MEVKPLLVGLFLLIGIVKAHQVTFWKDRFTLTCKHNGKWFHNAKPVGDNHTETYEAEYNSQTRGLYHCVYDTTKEYFFVEAKVCKNCFELDASLFAMVIILDVSGTVLMMILIYRCTKRKVAEGHQSFKAPVNPGGSAQKASTSSPHYEALKTHKQDPYAVLSKNR